MKYKVFLLALIGSLAPFFAEAAPLKLQRLRYLGDAGQESAMFKVQSRKVKLAGWQLQNENGDSYEFPALTAKKGQLITVYTGQGRDRTKGARKKLYWQRTNEAWHDQAGTLRVYNAAAQTMIVKNYGQSPNGGGKKVFFVHHSTGQIYWDNGMQTALAARGYEGSAPWWDGGTDPPDFPGLFNDSASWQTLGDANIVIFKSCYPASDITSDAMLEDYKRYYRQLYEVYAAHPDVLFVPLSTPPLLRVNTTLAAATRSLQFEAWLLGEYKNAYSGTNLAPFGLHSLLSDAQGYLRNDFKSDDTDNHPNAYSGQVVGPAIADFLDSVR